ncbi:alkyl hydroperoxide reductase subunit F, partial [Sanguibacter sp. 26GB23]
QNIVNPIEITVSTNGSAKAEELLSLAREITEMKSDKITLSVNENSAGRAPQMAIGPLGQVPRVRFAGIPMGHEFTSLVLALL